MRLFLAVPRDLADQRATIDRVVERWNDRVEDAGQNGGDGEESGNDTIEIIDWHAVAAPVEHLPESIAFRDLAIDPDDLFVGTTWLAFDDASELTESAESAGRDGAPDGSTEPPAGATERDLELAYRYWKTLRRPRCVFLRAMRLPATLADIDTRRFDRVGLFYRRFDEPEKNRFVFDTFETPEELEDRLEAALTELVGGGGSPTVESASAGEPRAHRPGGPTRFEQKMQPGRAYEVSFLSIEIDGWNELVERHGAGERLRALSGSFLELVRSTAQAYGGEVFNWGLRGGLVMFWTRRGYDHALMTGLKVLHNLPVFNLDPAANPLGHPIRLRAAAHDAVIVFQLPVDEIRSDDLRFVVQLQRESTDADELTIPRRLLERIDERLRPHFQFKGRYEREPIFSCKLPTGSDQTIDDLDSARAEFLERADALLELLGGGNPEGAPQPQPGGREPGITVAGDAAPGVALPGIDPQAGPMPSTEAMDAGRLEAATGGLDAFYSALGAFAQTHVSIDPEATPETLERIADTSAALRRAEVEVWTRLRANLSHPGIGLGTARRLEALVHSASRRRSRPVVILEKLEQRCRLLAAGRPAPASPPVEVGEELLRAVDRLVKADELDNETALTELLLNHKKALLGYLLEGPKDDRKRALLDKLWETADLLLLDDLFSIRGHQRRDDTRVTDVLIQPQVADGRFAVLRGLLARGSKVDVAALRRAFAELGGGVAEPTAADAQTVWRSIVVGHADEDVRNHAALQLDPQAMWQVISHPSIPITSIHAIGERMSRREGEDARKIFFDCTRSRIEEAVDTFATRVEFNAVTKLIMLLLGFSFLVETGYFERFDDILRKFLERAQSKGLKVDYFERLRRTLDATRRELGDQGPAKPPAGVKSLPLTIQRRLAGEARYIYWFVTHPDPRIALETLRHIGLMHVERVLRLKEINLGVLQGILRKPELFTRQQAIIAALNHPKCTQDFANKYIASMTRSRGGRQALEKIARNPSASPVVRSSAKRSLAQTASTSAARRR